MPLLDQAAQQMGPGAQPAAPPMQGEQAMQGAAPGAEPGDMPDAEQDQQLDAFIDNAYRIIYGGETADGDINPQIAESLRAGVGTGAEGGGETGNQSAIQALASTAATVGAAVAGSAAEQGVPIDGPGVVLPATLSLVEDLADVAVREGIYDYSEDEMTSAATLTGEKLFEMTKDLGLWKQEEFDAAVQETLRMNQTGELDQMMPGTAEAMKGGGAPGGAPGGAAPAEGGGMGAAMGAGMG